MYRKLLSKRKGTPGENTIVLPAPDIKTRTQIKIMKVAIVSIATFTLALGIFASPSLAWGGINHWINGTSTISVCKGSGWDSVISSAWPTVHGAIFRWNNYNYGQPKFVDAHSWCNYTVSLNNNTGGLAARSAIDYSNGYITHVETNFYYDARNFFWWYGADQDCWVGVGNGCKMDAFTIAFHEAGHALGLMHNTRPDTDQRCVTGYYSTNSAAACDYYGEAVMHWNSGIEFMNNAIGYGYTQQGYRHLYPTADDLGALNQY